LCGKALAKVRALGWLASNRRVRLIHPYLTRNAGQANIKFGDGDAMRPDELKLVEIPASDAVALEKIGRLRVLAWSTELPEPPAEEFWLDEFDGLARHWAFLYHGEPIASTRMTIHERLEDVPAPEDFVGVVREALPSPIASSNRTVVAPAYRGLGLSRELVETCIRAAEEAGCRCVVGSTPSGERLVRQLISQGFVVLGSAGKPHVTRMFHALPPAVALVCHLPRKRPDAEPSAAADLRGI